MDRTLDILDVASPSGSNDNVVVVPPREGEAGEGRKDAPEAINRECKFDQGYLEQLRTAILLPEEYDLRMPSASERIYDIPKDMGRRPSHALQVRT